MRKEEIFMAEFRTPPNHIAFLAKKLMGEAGKIQDVSVAYLEKGGGGPLEKHTHSHNHLFIVTEGEAKLLLGEEIRILKKDEAFFIEGTIPHSVWNNMEETTKMIGITVGKKD